MKAPRYDIVDLSDAFPNATLTKKDVAKYLASLAENNIFFESADGKIIGIKNDDDKIQHIKTGKNYNEKHRREIQNKYKYILSLEKIVNNSIENKDAQPPRNQSVKPTVEEYHYFRSYIKIGEKYFELKLVAEEFKEIENTKKIGEMRAHTSQEESQSADSGLNHTLQHSPYDDNISSQQVSSTPALYVYDIFETYLNQRIPNPEEYIRNKQYRDAIQTYQDTEYALELLQQEAERKGIALQKDDLKITYDTKGYPEKLSDRIKQIQQRNTIQKETHNMENENTQIAEHRILGNEILSKIKVTQTNELSPAEKEKYESIINRQENHISILNSRLDNFPEDWRIAVKHNDISTLKSIHCALCDCGLKEYDDFLLQEEYDSYKKFRKDVITIQDELKKELKNKEFKLKEIELSRDNYNTLFPESRIESPIETVKIGSHQFEKLEKKERDKILSAVYETLSTPDIILNEKRLSVFNDLENTHVYGKSYLLNGKNKSIQSVVVTIENENITISTHERSINNLVNKIKMPEQLIYTSPEIGQVIERLKKSITVNPTRGFAPPNRKYNIENILSIKKLIESGKLTVANIQKETHNMENENTQTQEQQQIEQNVTNTLIDKIRKTGLDVIIDKEKMREILESGQYVQKMAAYHGTSHENEGETFFNGYGTYDEANNTVVFVKQQGRLKDFLVVEEKENKLIFYDTTFLRKEIPSRLKKITPERNQGQEKITGVRHTPSTIEQGLSEAAAGISTLSEKSLESSTSLSQNPKGNTTEAVSSINDNSNISQNENLSIDRHNRTNNPNLKNLEKVLDAWKQQEMKMENDVSINTTGYNSVWIDNWRIVNGEPVLVADSHKEIGWKIFYEGQPCIENEVNYEFAYIADDNLLQAAGMNIGDVLQLVQDKLGGVCNQIDPKAHPLSAEEYEQHLNKDLRATNKYLEEMEQSGWGYYDTRVNGHKQLPDGTFNANAAAIDFDWIMDDLKNTGQEYLDIVYSIRDAVESANENENIAGTLLRKYDNEYFERKRDDYNKSLPQKHYSPSNLVEQNEEKSVKPQRQQKEITRTQQRDEMEW